MPGEWTEVRRSQPAEYVRGVPDDAITWAAWTRGDQSVTIYQVERRDEYNEPYGEFYVTKSSQGSVETVEGPVSENRAHELAEQYKTEGFIGF